MERCHQRVAISLRELGPNMTYGWVILEDGFSSGVQYDISHIYAVMSDNIASIGDIILRETENEGSGCDKVCSDYSTKLLIDPTAQNVRFYPLVLRASGIKKGQLFDRTYRVPFSKLAFKYVLPSDDADPAKTGKISTRSAPAQSAANEGCNAVATDTTTTETREIDGVIIQGVKKGEAVTGLRLFWKMPK